MAKKNTVTEADKRVAELEAELASKGKEIIRLEMASKSGKRPKQPLKLDAGQTWTIEGRQALSINPMSDPMRKNEVGEKERYTKPSGNPNGGLVSISQCDPSGKEAQRIQIYWDQLWNLVTNAEVQKATKAFLIKNVDIARTYQHKSSDAVSFKDTEPVGGTRKYFVEHTEGLKVSDFK